MNFKLIESINNFSGHFIQKVKCIFHDTYVVHWTQILYKRHLILHFITNEQTNEQKNDSIIQTISKGIKTHSALISECVVKKSTYKFKLFVWFPFMHLPALKIANCKYTLTNYFKLNFILFHFLVTCVPFGLVLAPFRYVFFVYFVWFLLLPCK